MAAIGWWCGAAECRSQRGVLASARGTRVTRRRSIAASGQPPFYYSAATTAIGHGTKATHCDTYRPTAGPPHSSSLQK
ncbi:unnamed protein product [Leptosia nina]|uniref:Secreted protein n=1 Tax=Leptosia nina TaxID=320188 RepID=A0AAV1IXZ0_9NEOP